MQKFYEKYIGIFFIKATDIEKISLFVIGKLVTSLIIPIKSVINKP